MGILNRFDSMCRCWAASYLTLGLAIFVSASSSAENDSLSSLYNNLAVNRGMNGDFAVAREYLDSARIMGGDKATILNNMANCMLCEGLTSRAIELYDSCVDLGREDSMFLFNSGVAYYLNGAIDEAMTRMQSVAEYAASRQDNEFVQALLKDMGIEKSSALRMSREEIMRLFRRADSTLAEAVKSDTMAVLDSLRVKKDSLLKKKKVIRRKLAPAGEKARQVKDLALLLYWKLL